MPAKTKEPHVVEVSVTGTVPGREVAWEQASQGGAARWLE